MPVNVFANFEDGLEPSARQRDHFITGLDFDDERLWVPYGETAWFQPCRFDVTTGGFTAVLKALPGTVVPKHYHVSTVQGWTLQGSWRYLEHDWVATAGTTRTVSRFSSSPVTIIASRASTCRGWTP
jgi:hypothetical protein